MIITDKNEAFRHNSCKKIAQLSKVIYAMIIQRQDRIDLLNDLNEEFEEFVLDLINQHQNQQEVIFNHLSKFRKSAINSSCQHFGALYKESKIEFANFLSDQNVKFQNLYDEAKFLQKDIRNFQMVFLQVAAKFLDSSDNFEKDIKLALNNNCAKEELIQKAVQPIYQKILNYNEGMKRKWISMENDHKSQEKELLAAFSIKLKKVLRKRLKPVFFEKKEQIRELKEEIVSFKSQYADIFQAHHEFTKMQLKRRNQLIDETHQNIRSIQKQMKSMPNIGNNQHNYASQIKSLEKTRTVNNQNFVKTMNQLVKEIRQLKHTRHQFTKSKTSELTTVQQKNRDLLFSIQKKFDSQSKNMMDTTAYRIELIKVASNDTKRLLSVLKKLIEQSLDKENSHQMNLRTKLEESLKNYQDGSDNIQKQSQTSFESFLTEFNILFGSKFLGFSKFIEANQKMSNDFNALKAQYSKKIESKMQKHQNEVNRYLHSCKEKEDGCIETNQNIYKRKQEMNQTKINNFKKKFQDELQTKINSINQENQNQLKSITKSDNSPIENNNSNAIQLKSKLKFWENQLIQTKNLYAKKIEAFDSEILNLDKTLRQIQRSIKSETQKIDEEYEIKIQIVQVDLEHKIENLSKLFTEDENRRATEIIESIRMINDVKNRIFDMHIKRKNDQKTNLDTKNKTLADMKDKINDYQNHITENKLKNKIDELTKVNSRTQFSLEKKRIEEISKINKEIEINKETINQKILSIKQEISNENDKFDSESSKIKSEVDQINCSKDQKISQIDFVSNDKLQIVHNDHQKNVESIKKKIEKCKKEKIEIENKLNQEKNALLLQLQNDETINSYAKFQFTDNHLTIDQKISSLIQIKASYADPIKISQMRKKDQITITNLVRSLQINAKNLSSEFDKTINNMKFAFRQKYDEPKTSRVDMSQRISLSSLPRNGSRSIVFDKSAPLLVTPQFV